MTLNLNLDKPFVCFIHIEKAGGMTMHQILHHSIPGYISPHPGFDEHMPPDRLSKLMRYWPQKINGTGGHRMGAFMNYEQAVKRPVFYFTFLRDPIKRYMSSINWKKYIMGQNWTVESYAEDAYYYNFQCFRVAGERSFEKARKIILEKYGFVGFMEQFDYSLLFLKNTLKEHKLDIRYVKENVKDYGDAKINWEDLSEEIQEKYRLNNAEDIKLYEFVCKELWPMYQEKYSGNLDQDYLDFKQELKTYEVPKILNCKTEIK